MITEVQLQQFVKAVAKKAERESRLATPHPQHYVYTDDLFDAVHDVFGVAKATIGQWVEEASAEEGP